ncbi:MAG: replication-associated recombination protein A [Clostridia bacterium]|nr:replication-associated recombination protein A [Oscillospiraceae bacterium]MBR6693470.1 replication-associated recombination protein A [Clostridia bacterium]
MATPLAEKIRPQSIDEIVGQRHLLAEGKALRRIIESGEIPNLIFYGPSGVGKTTVANMLAARCGKKLYRLNATTASISDIKEIISGLGGIESVGGVVLYLDEIQYFNKKQQQILLEYIERGDITLIASTTENPYFYVYGAILSRSTVFEFKTITAEEIIPAVRRAFGIIGENRGININIEPEAERIIAMGCGGDVRKAINAVELCALTAEERDGEIVVTAELCRELSQKSAMRYDREGDEHYDIISAYQKSMRGSDPDAALHYLARLLEAGDLPSACRRLLVCANEDVGLAYPSIIPIVKAAVDTALQLGLPEGRIPLANAVVLVATAPKSTSAYNGINAAIADVAAGKGGEIPRTLKNKHFDGADNKNPGQFYKYPHDFPHHYVKQQYLPDELKSRKYYNYGDNKTEQKFKEYWDKIKN